MTEVKFTLDETDVTQEMTWAIAQGAWQAAEIMRAERDALAARLAEAERLLRQALDADKYDWNMGLTDRIEAWLGTAVSASVAMHCTQK